jgi:hypothetical protein
MPGRERRVAYLRAAGSTLPDGGRVLLSFFPRAGASVHFRVATRVGSTIRRLRRRPPVEEGDALVPNFVHFFTREQITDELVEAGLLPLEINFDDYGWAVGEVRPRRSAEAATQIGR